MPNDIPFQVVGTTSIPVIIPDLSGMAKNSGKAAAKEVAKSAMQKIAGNAPKNAPQSAASTPVQAASNKKAGFFHNLFHRKDKNNNPAGGTQLASKKTKY
jgi:hypothetical protein